MTGYLNLPCVQGCTLADPRIKKNTLVREIIFNFKCGAPCERCHQMVRNGMTVNVSKALDYTRTSIDHARKNGFEELYIHIIGGEPLDSFEELKEYCAGVEKYRNCFLITVWVSSCARRLTVPVMEWFNTRPWIRFRLYWDENTPTIFQKETAPFLLKKTDTILWKIRKDRIPVIKKDLLILKKYFHNRTGALIIPQYSDLSPMAKADYAEYIKALSVCGKDDINLLIPEFAGCPSELSARRNIETYHVNGKTYFCKYMSLGYQLSSVISRLGSVGKGKECEKCMARNCCRQCPASSVMKTAYDCELLRRQYFRLIQIENQTK